MKYMIDYKGKHFIITDEVDEQEMTVGTLLDADITDEFLEEHVQLCLHYGIPPYVGFDEALEDRINKLIENYGDSDVQ